RQSINTSILPVRAARRRHPGGAGSLATACRGGAPVHRRRFPAASARAVRRRLHAALSSGAAAAGPAQRQRLPTDTETFISVRKDLYSSELNFPVDIDTLGISKLWINGFHDFVMNGQEAALSKNKNILTFYKSAHYPHIEENNHFSEILNEFIKHS
ncbi:TPA: hypothetical protein ACTUNM_003009, partial [Legionella pneumophila]